MTERVADSLTDGMRIVPFTNWFCRPPTDVFTSKTIHQHLFSFRASRSDSTWMDFTSEAITNIGNNCWVITFLYNECNSKYVMNLHMPASDSHILDKKVIWHLADAFMQRLTTMFYSYTVDAAIGSNSGLSLLLKDASTGVGVEPPTPWLKGRPANHWPTVATTNATNSGFTTRPQVS